MTQEQVAGQIGRRGVLALGGGAAAAVVLGACSPGSEVSDVASASSGAASGQALATVDQVPQGGGVVIPDPAIVVTQPESGVYKAFTAICPHQGCLVDQVVENEIVCPCHGSRFTPTGGIISGPATDFLTPHDGPLTDPAPETAE